MSEKSDKGRFARAPAILVISALAGGLAYSYFVHRRPLIPTGTLRIGFESNPPFQTRTAGGFGGLAIDVVNEAARRTGLRLQWVETGTSSEEALQRSLVDLWPLMAILPERRKRVHFSEPWVIGHNVLLMRNPGLNPDQEFSGRIAVFRLPLNVTLVRDSFPRAQVVSLPESRDVLREVCLGGADAGLLEKRVALDVLKQMPSECGPAPVRVVPIPGPTLNAVASTFQAAAAADLIRREIAKMYRDGALSLIMARYSFYGLEDAWATYDLLESAERSRWIAWISAGLAAVLISLLWQAVSMRQRRRAERVLRESEERYRAIFQEAGIGVAQLSLDGKVEMANDRYCEVVGYSPPELVGKATRDLSHRDDLAEETALTARLLAGKIQFFSHEKRYTRSNGNVVWANICKSMIRDSEGRPKSLIAVVEDVTERRQAEAALRESEERFRNLADSAPVMIWMCGPDKRCTFFNRSWLEFTGHSLDEALQIGWAASVHPEEREHSVKIYEAAFQARRDVQLECRLRRADGEYRWILSRGVARFLEGGEFGGYIGCSIDLTDLRRAYEQHLAGQKLESVGVLASGVAHDFNNLLGAITSLAESALGELPPESGAAADLENIRETALRGAQISSQLMTFTRRDNAPAAPVDLSSIIAGMLDLLKVSISKSAALNASLAPDLPPILANPSEMRQVVMNLVINASEALEGRAGLITIVTSNEAGGGEAPGVRLEVSDSGSGMSEDVKGRLFDPFFSTRFVGRGLGLAAVQGIVRRLQGSIHVESEPDAGSRFIVRIPQGTLISPAPAQVPRGQEAAATASGPVLVVEDEESLRSSIARLLRRKGFEVVEADDGASAIAAFNGAGPAKFEFVLLDVTMPGMPGPKVFDEIRRISPAVKVIVSTAYSEETVRAEFGARDISGFIRKPYRIDDLLKVFRDGTGS